MPDIEGLAIEISTNSAQAEDGLSRLASSLEKIKTIVSGGLGLRRVVSELSKTAEETDKISGEAVSKLERMGAALENISKLNGIKISASLGTQLGRIANSTKEFEGANFAPLGNLVDYLQQIADIGSSHGFQNVASVLNSNNLPNIAGTTTPTQMGTTVDVTGAAGATTELGSVTEAANRTSRAMAILKAVLGRIKGAWGTFKENVTSSTKRLRENFNALVRIAKYRLIRTALKMVADAFKTGINNIYYYSQVVGTEFASQMDAAKSSLTTFKNSIGAAVAPLISSLIPVLQTVCGWLVTFNNLLAHFFAAISGKSTYSAAIAYTDKYGESLGGAGSAAKALRDYTAGFDELNVFKPDTDTGGGGGGGSTPDYGEMFEEREVGGKIKEIADWVTEHLGLIKGLVLGIAAGIAAWKISSMFTKSLSTIAGIAMIVSGLIIGITSGIDAWTNGVDWENLIGMLSGAALVVGGLALAFGSTAAGIGALVVGIGMLVVGIKDWITQGELSTETFWLLEGGIVAVCGGLALLTGSWIPLVVGAVLAAGLAIYKYWDEISGFFVGLWNTISTAASTAWDGIEKAWKGAGEWLKENITGPKIAKAIRTGFDKLWKPIQEYDWKGLGYDIGQWFGTAVKDAITFVTKTLPEWLSDVWTEIKEGFRTFFTVTLPKFFKETLPEVVRKAAEFFKELPGKIVEFVRGVWDDVVEIGTAIVEGIFEGLATIWTAITEFVDGFVQGFKDALGIASPSTVFMSIGEDVAAGLLQGIKDWLGDIKTWVDTNVIKPFQKALDGALEFAVEVKNDAVAWWANVKKWWGEKVSQVSEFTTAVKNEATTWWNNVKGWWRTVAAPGLQAAVSLVKSGWTTLVGFIGNYVSVAISLFKSGWSSLTNFVGSAVSAGVSLWRNGWSSIASFIGTSVSVGISLFKSGWSSIKSFFGLGSGGIIGANGGVKAFAGGGTISPTGKSSWWNSVNKYGNGTDSARGTMFVAGEAGPEIVGHVNGRTEVLNKSQLASTMKIAVIEGLARFANYWRSVTSQMAVSTNGIISAVATYSLSAADLNRISQQVMARQVDGAAIVSELERRTSTVDSGQIAEGIASGVSGGNLELIGAIYAMADRVVAAVEESSGDVRIGDDVIGRSYDRYTQKRGLPVNKGAFANAY